MMTINFEQSFLSHKKGDHRKVNFEVNPKLEYYNQNFGGKIKITIFMTRIPI